HPNDASKLIRAIEVCLASRQPMSALWQEKGRNPLRGYRILRTGLNPDRGQLYERINLRAAAMFEQGLIDETRYLVKKYSELSRSAPFTSLGYKQAAAHLNGELTLAQAITLTQQGHRNYAKRQMTWFRREPEVRWLGGFGDDNVIAATAVEMVQAAAAAGPSSG